MKQLLLSLLITTLPIAAFAQVAKNNITIGVAPIGAGSNLPPPQAAKMETKMAQLIERSGHATIGYSGGVLLVPVLSVENTRVTEGGMEHITVTSAELILMLVSAADDRIIYSTLSKKVKGSGTSAMEAMSNTIADIDVTEKTYKDFIAGARTKIDEYYAANCDLVLERAATAEKQRDYEAAVGLLHSVPPGTPCYQAAHKRALQLFDRYEGQLCEKVMTYARGEMAIGNYDAALDALATIGGKSACSEAANKLIADADKKVQRHIDRQYNLQAQQARALETIAMGYYMRAAKKRK